MGFFGKKETKEEKKKIDAEWIANHVGQRVLIYTKGFMTPELMEVTISEITPSREYMKLGKGWWIPVEKALSMIDFLEILSERKEILCNSCGAKYYAYEKECPYCKGG